MRTENEFFQRLRACPQKNYQCRYDEIQSFGVRGIQKSFRGALPTPAQKNPSPSFNTIDKAMKILAKGLGYILGKEFKVLNQTFRLIYRPHFKVLKMFDKAMQRYWGSLEFIRWSMEILSALEKSIQSYVFLTKNFEMRPHLEYFSQLQKNAFDAALEDLKVCAHVLATFDQGLLNDLNELLETISQGLNQAQKELPAETKIDQLALGAQITELQMLRFQYGQNFKKMVDNLEAHAKSWARVNATGGHLGSLNTVDRLKVKLVGDKMAKTVDQLRDLSQGRK